MNDQAQLHTLEGLGAAVLVTMTVLIITQSAVVVTPQSEMFMQVDLEQTASDTLTILDIAPQIAVQNNLTECVASYNVSTEATLLGGELDILDEELSEMLADTMYNVDLAYVNNGNLTVKHVVANGMPTDNSVIARRLVTLDNATVTNSGGTWDIADGDLLVVEVRLTAWQT
ncbi:MAG: hypothetical protein U9N13_07910 [Euryarchaeota archaeon]|nr:hypothetical protein [Euryarchaeota archaeon]